MYTLDGLLYIDDLLLDRECQSNIQESFHYSCLLAISYSLDSNFFLIHALQILVASMTVAYGFICLKKVFKNVAIAAIAIAVLVLLPINGYATAWTERDVLFSWLGLTACFIFLSLLETFKTRKIKFLDFLPLIVVITFATCLRKEAFLWFLVLALFLRDQKTPNGGLLLKIGFVVVINLVLFIFFLPFMMKGVTGYSGGKRFNQQALVTSVTYILKKMPQPFSAEIRMSFGGVLDLDKISDLKNGVSYPRSLILDYPDEAFGKFVIDALILICRHPLWFFEARWEILKSTFSGPFLHDAVAAKNHIPDFLRNAADYISKQQDRESGVYLFLENRKKINPNDFVYIIFWTPLVGLVLIFLGVLLYRKNDFIFWFSVIPFIQFLVVFLFQPEGKPKYLYLIYLYAPIAFFMYLFLVVPEVFYQLQELKKKIQNFYELKRSELRLKKCEKN